MKDNDKILQTSGKITLAFLAFVLMLIGWIGDVFSYGTQSGTLLDLRRGSRVTDYMFHQPLVDTYTFYFGTQSVTGSGATGYITGTSTALPRLQYNASGLTFNFVGATLQNEGVDVTVSSDLTGYIAVSGGTGTDNVLTNPTLAGGGTISANIALSGNITANSLEITPVEVSYLNNASSEIQAQITTATGSITNHTHTGADGTTQISHDSVTGTGTNSHATIDNFIASKAQASGLASLDGSSLVVQNPASGTTTPSASKILIADGAGKIADGWLNSTITALGQTIELGTETTGNTDNVGEGSSNLYYLDSRVNAAVGSLSVSAHSDIIFTSPAEGHKLVFDSSLNVVNATDTAIVAWSGITGNPTDNGSVSVTSGAGYIPVAGSDGKLDYGWQKDVIRLTGTTTSPEAGAYGSLYVQSSVAVAVVVGTETVLLLQMDNPGTTTFVDSSDSAKTVTVAGDAIGTTTAKFGSGGGAFDGTGDNLSVGTSTDFVFGTGDLTIDFWLYSMANSQDGKAIVSNRDGANNNCWIVGLYSGAINLHSGATVISVATTVIPLQTWTHVAVVRSGTTLKTYINGTSEDSDTNSMDFSVSNGVKICRDGTYDAAGAANVVLDEVRISKGVAQWTGNFTPPTAPYASGNHTQYSAKYDDPVNGNTVFEILTPGTATMRPSYIYNNATTTVFGLGTNTAITGTTTAYSGWFDGAVRATAFNVASTEKIKENLKPIKIKPDVLEAESTAKVVYVKDKKPAWFVDNEVNYTYVGTDSATYVDTAAMEADYVDYIELAWASDLNQDTYIDTVQKAQEKYFWQMFDGIQPKSWNPKGDPSLERKGFVVEEMPDVVKGNDKQSIDPMALIAYIAVSMQSIKQDNVTIMQALRDFAATGTFTVSAIEDRLEVLEHVQ